MQSTQARDLALSLLKADSESAVIKILTDVGYWNNNAVWRNFGDMENNYSTIGNQQTRPAAAIVEKLVNSVDARLMAECYLKGISPTSEGAPASIREAVGRFFEGWRAQANAQGTIKSWPKATRTREAHNITVAVTGPTPRMRQGMPSLTISDQGEGQVPSAIPKTFLSLNKKNKLRIRFVQGKFNMGGTGALKFCGADGLQLVLTKRNPRILRTSSSDDPMADHWGFSIIRRFRPTDTAGEVRNSVYKFLAPVFFPGSERGDVLTFRAEVLDILPEGKRAYARSMRWGSVLKLYEYDMTGFASHALRKDGLLSKLELLLPDIALPVRVHECRAFKGSKGSYDTTLVGLTARLERDYSSNLEAGFPTSLTLRVQGATMTAKIYAFKAGAGDAYRKDEGIIFTVNGQTHGHIGRHFFNRKRVGMSRLAKSLLVSVECSALPTAYREDLFMNSRDRLSDNKLKKTIERQLEDELARHRGLRNLRNRRRKAEVEERLKDARPLEDVLSTLLKNSPALERLLATGQRLSAPHRSRRRGGKNNGETASEFVGEKHPSFWMFSGLREGRQLKRTAQLGRRCRIKFETDVANDYFIRSRERGWNRIVVQKGELGEPNHTVTLHDGVANWTVDLSEGELNVGDEIELEFQVGDQTLVKPHVNRCRLTMAKKRDNGGGGGGKRKRLPNKKKGGEGGAGTSVGNTQPGGVAMPEIYRVSEDRWKEYGFTRETGCKVIEDPLEDGSKRTKLTFYVNIDNIYLRTEMKQSRKADADIMQARFVFGNVFIGLAILNAHRANRKERHSEKSEAVDPLEEVARTTQLLAPVIIPMIENLGALDD